MRNHLDIKGGANPNQGYKRHAFSTLVKFEVLNLWIYVEVASFECIRETELETRIQTLYRIKGEGIVPTAIF